MIQTVPTAHAKFVNWTAGEYRREKSEMTGQKLADWVDALKRTRRVVVTEDASEMDSDGKTRFQRKGYIGVFDVDDIELQGDGEDHAFKLVRRLKPI